MGKKYKDQKKIAEYLFDDYIYNKDLTSNDQMIKSLELLIDNGLGCKITASEDVSEWSVSRYAVACKFMLKYNKDLKKFKRELLNAEIGGIFQTADTDERLVELTKNSLDVGTYYAYLGNKKHDDYAVLTVSHPDNNDLYQISFELFLIGKRFLKFKDEFTKLYKEYKEIYKSKKNEYIWYTDGRPVKDANFKAFDKMVFTDKGKIIKYIDNWVDNIPNYYKYGMTPKLSIMLYGEPGTGKSTFTKALAKYLGIENVLSISPDFFRADEQQHNRNRGYYMSPYREIVSSIDDIDCVCNAREDDQSSENNITMSTLLEYLDNPGAFYYKAKDGKDYLVSIIVATTNYYDKLDPAVKRHGRFDLKIEMKYFDKKEAEEMCAIYDLKLKDVYHEKIDDDFKISPSYLQALCLENIDKSLKDNYD